MVVFVFDTVFAKTLFCFVGWFFVVVFFRNSIIIIINVVTRTKLLDNMTKTHIITFTFYYLVVQTYLHQGLHQADFTVLEKV